MTSVTDLGGDQAAAHRRASWLKSSRKERQGAIASRSRSASQSRVLPRVPDEEELPDYEDDEEPVVDQRAHLYYHHHHYNNSLEQVASFQEPAMTQPHASHYEEDWGSDIPEASIETDPSLDTEYQVGSSFGASDTVAGSEYAAAAGSGTYEAAVTTRPVEEGQELPSRDATPDIKELARAYNSGSDSGSEPPSPGPRLVRRFEGFVGPAAAIQHGSEAQQPAREPGNTSTSAATPVVESTVDDAASPTTRTTPEPVPTEDSKPVMEADEERKEVEELEDMKPTFSASEGAKGNMEPRFSASRDEKPTLSASRESSGEPSSFNSLFDEHAPSHLGSEEAVVGEEKNSLDSVKICQAQATSITRQDNASQTTTTHSLPLLKQPFAPIPPDFTEEEIQEMMAGYDGGPSQDELDFLSFFMHDCDGRMDLDDPDNPELYYAAQSDARQRFSNLRDADIQTAKSIGQARRKTALERLRQDEAPDADPVSSDSDTNQDIDDDQLYTEHLLESSSDHIEAEKKRLQVARDHWKSRWPDPSTFQADHWEQQARIFLANQASAFNVLEKSYWANRNIQAEAYAAGKFKSGRLLNFQIRLAIIDWARSIAASEAEADAFTEQISQIQLTEEDAEAPLRAQLALFLSQLPPHVDQKVTEILEITTPGREIVQSPEGNMLLRKDFATLLDSANYNTGKPEGWLNDEIINGFFTALCNAMNDKAGHTKGKVPPFASYITGWYGSVQKKGMSAIERWSRRKGIKGEKLLECKRIFFPVNPGNHWSLLVICPDIRTIEYLDSLDIGQSDTNRKSTHYIELGRKWLQMELGDKYVQDEWTDVDRRSSIQDNGSDCGVFTCLNGFASALALSNPRKEFGPQHIPNARRAMVAMFKFEGFNTHFEL
jgi:sentrin-specific protease 1